MTCTYCGRVRCHHLGPEENQQTAPNRPRGAVLPTTPTATTLSLFALGDRAELVCVACSHVIPNGPDAAYLRARHGQWHVRRREAVEDRRGLPEGAVRYTLVKR